MTEETRSLAERFSAIVEQDAAESAPVEDGQGEEEVVETEEVEAAEDGDKEYVSEDIEEPEYEEDEPEEAPAPLEAIDIEVDGQTKRLTAAEVRDGILMRSDYTRKTQELANERKALEAERTEFQQFASQQVALIQELSEPEPDWNQLADDDPLGLPKKQLEWQQKQAKRQELIQGQYATAVKRVDDTLDASRKRIPELIPEWSDGELAGREMQEIGRAMMETYGFSELEVGGVPKGHPQYPLYPGIIDARLLAVARDAMLYRKGKTAAQETVKKKVAGKPKVQKPGSAPAKQSQKTKFQQDRARAKKTGRREDMRKVFEHFV